MNKLPIQKKKWIKPSIKTLKFRETHDFTTPGSPEADGYDS
jgi:hypothetical protein